jgi:hypothetical protein
VLFLDIIIGAMGTLSLTAIGHMVPLSSAVITQRPVVHHALDASVLHSRVLYIQTLQT